MSKYLRIMVNASLKSAGINDLSAEQFLDIGHPGFLEVPEELRIKAYRACCQDGWHDEGLVQAMEEIMDDRFDSDTSQYIIQGLKKLAKFD